MDSSRTRVSWLCFWVGVLALACAADEAEPSIASQAHALVGSVDVRVSSGADDAEQSASGAVNLTSTDLELVTDGSRGAQLVGMRFLGLAIPPGATITNAYIEFTADETNSGATSLTFRAQAIDDAPGFTTASSDISNRALTDAAVGWTPAAWAGIGQTHSTPDLSSVIQEVVSRSGWSAGNDLVIVVNGSGERTAESYNGSASEAPLLHIEYDDNAASPVCGDAACNGVESCSTCPQDCGSCPSCEDGIQNQGELGVDCGGPCPTCAGLPSSAWLEAEVGMLSGSPGFSVVTDASASGGAYLVPTSNNTGAPGPNRALYTVDVADGAYRLWGRVIAPSAGDDSFWIKVDDGRFVRWNDIARSTTWTWDLVHDSDAGGSAMVYPLAAGTHTIEVANRENGTLLDELYLTADGDTPSGMGDGSAASCGDGSCNGSEDCGSCASDCGECPASCGDGSCSGSEDCGSCASDCGECPASCGDGSCNGAEDCETCVADCGECSSLPSNVWLEAESGVLSGTPTFSVLNDGAASGGVYLSPTSNDTGSPGPNRVTFSFEGAAGTYRVWGRVIAPTAGDDSFWISVDGGAFIRWNDISRSSTWLWDSVHDSDDGGAVVDFVLSEGVHTLQIANRENGVSIDKLYVTADGDTPSGVGGSSGTCTDGAQNQGETGEDCGGPCPECPMFCGDAVCDGGEDCDSCSADCGACPSCSDGQQNQGETGIDCGGSCPACPDPCADGCGDPTEENLLVAFIGDQGNNGNSDSVLQLIVSEGADAVVHNGDFDYQDNPTAWDNRITTWFGDDYPYFAVVGNHDAAAWSGPNGYAAKIQARHAKNPEMACTGELGVRANCTFRGLHMIQSCIGTNELRSSCNANSADQLGFLQSSLAASSAIFKICNWHKNQRDMQVGAKSDEVGWSAYEACMNAGAIVSTGHEHSYARTLTLADVGNAGAAHGALGAFDVVNLSDGQNFVFVSGLAGVGIRAFTSSHASDTWWASYATSDRWLFNGVQQSGSADYGALFIRFFVEGTATRAHGYFKDVSGRILDDFIIEVQ